ncbi:MAG: FAD-binding and (Fe-S)-binding domain-containing protein, partial [Endozoicomonas sp.]
SVLADGTVWKSTPVDNDVLEELCEREDRVGDIYNTLKNIHDQYKDNVVDIFPQLNRNLTGYDLANIRNKNNQLDLNAILCGSEGTLAIISEVKVNLLSIPKYSALVLVFYKSFQDSLQDAQSLMAAEPSSIETIDSRVLSLAKANSVWESVKDFFPVQNADIDGINFVEFTGDSEEDVQQGIDRLKLELEKPVNILRAGSQVVMGTANVKKIWNMRKQAVGLLGNMEGDARPIPFVEDVAVPPENLADFILAFRALLNKHNLSYGMFGHVDAGVLHVRPAIDMKDPEQEKLVRLISDDVAALAKKHGGVLWGEHGKGVRSEYAPAFFADLYPVLQDIKGVFDPYNQLNPGKIATPATLPEPIELLKIDEVPTRGQQDREIGRTNFEAFTSGLYCNGNGACFNYSPNSAMCPTWKATYDRIQSPKGRSGLVREWLRLQTAAGVDVIRESAKIRNAGPLYNSGQKLINQVNKWRGEDDFSHDVYGALDNCMSCKSCAGQCPIQVNVPDLRARYFELYHGCYPRPLKHHIASLLEPMLPVLAKMKPAYNLVMRWPLTNTIVSKSVGLQDIPAITSTSPERDMCRVGAAIASRTLLDAIPESERYKTVIIIQDAFTSFFDTPLLTDLVELLTRLGYRPLVAPYKPNGKVLHVYGFLGRFQRVAKTNGEELKALADSGISLMGIDAAVTLTYRDEYKEVMGDDSPNVFLMSEWFASQSEQLRKLNLHLSDDHDDGFTLLGHCTEITNVPLAPVQWQQLFNDVGMKLTYRPTGCCGMAGIYGHETRNQEISRKLYDLSWKTVVQNPATQGRVVATGYSCRSQVKRYGDGKLLHPIQVILQALK